MIRLFGKKSAEQANVKPSKGLDGYTDRQRSIVSAFQAIIEAELAEEFTQKLITEAEYNDSYDAIRIALLKVRMDCLTINSDMVTLRRAYNNVRLASCELAYVNR